jgi:hypothetical protein
MGKCRIAVLPYCRIFALYPETLGFREIYPIFDCGTTAEIFVEIFRNFSSSVLQIANKCLTMQHVFSLW